MTDAHTNPGEDAPTPEPAIPPDGIPVPAPATPANPATPTAAANQKPALHEDGEQPVLAAFWEVVKRTPAYARLIAAMSRDPDVPAQAKATLLVGGAYLVSPIDLIPGLIPIAGQIDDLYVVLTALQLAVRTSPPEVATRHLAAQGLDRDRIDHDLAIIRRLVRVGVQRAIRLSSKVAVEATHRAARLTSKARNALANRGTSTS